MSIVQGFNLSLTEGEEKLLEANELSFRGYEDGGSLEHLLLHNSEMGNCYWFAERASLKFGIMDFVKRPMATSRLMRTPIVTGKFNLESFKSEPWPMDYYEKKEKASPCKTTNIYFIQATSGGPVKIGMANSIECRLKLLQTGNPSELIVVAIIENVEVEFEAVLHREFSDYLIRGEWFDPIVIEKTKTNYPGVVT